MEGFKTEDKKYPNSIVLFYSKFSEKCKLIQPYMASTNFINKICIDSKQVRDIITSDKTLSLTHVPSIFCFYDDKIEKFIGSDAINWLEHVNKNLSNNFFNTNSADNQFSNSLPNSMVPNHMTPNSMGPNHMAPNSVPNSSQVPTRIMQDEDEDEINVIQTLTKKQNNRKPKKPVKKLSKTQKIEDSRDSRDSRDRQDIHEINDAEDNDEGNGEDNDDEEINILQNTDENKTILNTDLDYDEEGDDEKEHPVGNDNKIKKVKRDKIDLENIEESDEETELTRKKGSVNKSNYAKSKMKVSNKRKNINKVDINDRNDSDPTLKVNTTKLFGGDDSVSTASNASAKSSNLINLAQRMQKERDADNQKEKMMNGGAIRV